MLKFILTSFKVSYFICNHVILKLIDLIHHQISKDNFSPFRQTVYYRIGSSFCFDSFFSVKCFRMVQRTFLQPEISFIISKRLYFCVFYELEYDNEHKFHLIYIIIEGLV